MAGFVEEDMRRQEERIKVRAAAKANRSKSKASLAPLEESKGGLDKSAVGALSSQLGGDNGTGDVLAGAGQGFAVGGPWGAAAGAALGLVKGMAKRKQKIKDLKSASLKEQGQIAVDTASKSNAAITNIMQGFRDALLGIK